MYSVQYPFIPSSHPKHPHVVILYNNQLQLALLLKEEVKKAKPYKCKSFPIYKFPKKLYALITKSFIWTYSFLKTLHAVSTQDLNQNQTIILFPTAKGLSIF